MADHTWRDTYLRMRETDPNRSLYTPTDSAIEESRFVETVAPGSEADQASTAVPFGGLLIRGLMSVAVLLTSMLCLWLAVRLFFS